MDSLKGKPDLETNQAVCFNCGTVLTSNSQYDMVVCSCGAMAVDGGNNLRIIELKENPARSGGLSPSADSDFTVVMSRLDQIAALNPDHIKSIDHKLYFLIGSLQRDKQNLYEKWSELKKKCTHPNIGEFSMFRCPDCDWSGEPDYPEELSERDYAQYEETIKKVRELNRKLKTIYSSEEVKKFKSELQNQIKEVESLYKNQINILNKEKNELISERIKNCSHPKLRNSYCPDCEIHFSDPETLF